MATKKIANKKIAATETTESKPAAKVAAKKTMAAKPTGTTVSLHAAAAAKSEAPAKAKPQPSHHDIETHAYLLWEREGKRHGHHDQYWQRAEHELKG